MQKMSGELLNVEAGLCGILRHKIHHRKVYKWSATRFCAIPLTLKFIHAWRNPTRSSENNHLFIRRWHHHLHTKPQTWNRSCAPARIYQLTRTVAPVKYTEDVHSEIYTDSDHTLVQRLFHPTPITLNNILIPYNSTPISLGVTFNRGMTFKERTNKINCKDESVSFPYRTH